MGYFKTKKIAEKTWCISEPLGVGAFLLEGEDKALLLDTCNGFCDIRDSISKLTKRPLIVVNSHGHADHAGGNNQFKEIFIHEDDLNMLDPVYQQGQRDLLFGYAKKHYPIVRPLLWWLGTRKFEKMTPSINAIEEGHIFYLGKRSLEVIHFLGHSPGSILLADRQTKALFVGDAINNGLFLFFDGSPSLAEYASQLLELTEFSDFDTLWTSHSKQSLPFSYIEYYARFLERATLEKSTLTNIPNGDHPVYKYAEPGGRFGLKEIAVHFRKEAL